MCCTLRPLLCGLLLMMTPAGLPLSPNSGYQEAGENSTTTVLEVGGMSSPLCQLAIEITLGSIEGIGRVAVDRQQGEVRASHDPDKAPATMIAATIESLGFTATVNGQTSVRPPAQDGPSMACSLPVCIAQLVNLTGRSEDEVSRVVDFVTGHIMDSESIPTGQQVYDATGVTLPPEAVPGLQRAVLAKLLADPEGRNFAAMSRCTAYSACSLTRNLLNASAAELDVYRREKEEDGRTFDDFQLPAFAAYGLDGSKVRSADLNGRPVLMVFLALHCHHSIETLPILANLQEAHPEVTIVGIIVNSGSPRDVELVLPHYWAKFDRQFEVWVSEDPALGDLVESHLVPGFFFVDETGNVQQKLVGQKTEDQVATALRALQPARTESLRGFQASLGADGWSFDGLTCGIVDCAAELWNAGCDLFDCWAGSF